jgi:ketosteroid isomerase-like protein
MSPPRGSQDQASISSVSQRNVELYRRILQGWNDQGVDAVLEHFAEDVEIYDPDLPEGPRRGREQARRTIEQITSGFREMEVRGVEFHPVGDRVVALLHTVGEGESSHGEGLEMDFRDAHTLTFRDGEVVYWRIYLDRREALADAGLSLDDAAPVRPGAG